MYSPNFDLIKELIADNRALPIFSQYGLYGLSNIKQIGESLQYEASIRLSSTVLIGVCRIGAFTYIGGGSEIRRASIGRFCSIAANVAIGPAEHPVDWLSSHPFVFNGYRHFDSDDNWTSFINSSLKFRGNSAITQVGNDVWIGRNAIIRQGIKVGDGAIIAAGSFVNQDVPDYSIIGGIPARLIRYRFDSEVIHSLKSLQWWNFKLHADKNLIDFSDVKKSIDLIRTLILKKQIEKFDPINYLVTLQDQKINILKKIKN